MEDRKDKKNRKMANEKFCLKWNDFEQNISGAFRELKDDADFFDVTLACDSDEQVSAHKVILSACSPFFRQVLRRHKHQHPLLYLRGVSFSDLESVLAFMYNGEVNIAQEQLNSFLAVAEDLKVKGLTQGKDGGQTDSERSKSPRQPTTTTSYKGPSQRNSNVMSQPPPKRARPDPTNYHEDDEIQEVIPVKTELGATAMEEGKVDVAGYEEESYEDYGGYEEQQYEGTAGALANTQTGMEISKGESLLLSVGACPLAIILTPG